jgi:hypothetical protein
MDCTHVGWHKCPVDWTNLMTGASGKPTIAFKVVVNHNRCDHQYVPYILFVYILSVLYIP